MADDAKDGGPAFPEAFYPTPQSDAPDYRGGMSLRDWFAGQALTPTVAVAVEQAKAGAPPPAPTELDLAKAAYKMADAMLEARKAGA